MVVPILCAKRVMSSAPTGLGSATGFSAFGFFLLRVLGLEALGDKREGGAALREEVRWTI